MGGRRQAGGRAGARVCAAALALAGLLALAAGELRAAGATLVEQKLRLLEGYFDSDAGRRIRDGGDHEALQALSRAQGLVVEARDALSGGDAGRAATLADDALRAFSSATRLAKRPQDDSAPQRARYAELRDAIGAFRASLAAAQGDGAAGGVDLAALDAESARAHQLAAEGYFPRANALLAETYESTMRAIARSRGSETVVYRLEFRTPADELAYERERFRGNELLLEMLRERGASESAQRLAGRFAATARERRDAALAQAASGDVSGAIDAMEEATALLGRALRALGLSFAP